MISCSPRRLRPLRALALLLLAFASGACWGSASESPWPAEPADVDLGPAGEEELRNPGRNAPAATQAKPKAPPSASAAKPKSEREGPASP